MVSAVKVDGQRLHELARAGHRGRAGAPPGDRPPLRRRAARRRPGRLSRSRSSARRAPTSARWPPTSATRSAAAPTCATCAAPPSARSPSPRPARSTPSWCCRRARRCATTRRSVVRPTTSRVAVGLRQGARRATRWASSGDGPWAVLDARRRPAGGLRARTRDATVKPAVVVAPAERGIAVTAADGSLTADGDAPRRRASCPRRPTGTVVTIGAYDGVHLGHRAVIAPGAASWRPSAACRRAVVTFDRHPASVVRPESAPLLLTDLDQKLELLGRDRRRLHARHPLRRGPVAGAGRGLRHRGAGRLPRRPGRGRRRGLPLRPPAPGQRRAARARWAPTLGFEVHRASSWSALDGAPAPERRPGVVDRHPRAPWPTGDLAAANAMLGRPHEVRGVVGHGDERARELGFPHRQRRPCPTTSACRPTASTPAGTCAPDGVARPAAHLARPAADVLRASRHVAARGPPPRLRRRPLRRAGPGPVRRTGSATS